MTVALPVPFSKVLLEIGATPTIAPSWLTISSPPIYDPAGAVIAAAMDPAAELFAGVRLGTATATGVGVVVVDEAGTRLAAFDTTIAAMREAAPPLRKVMPSACVALALAVDRALAFDKEARWPNAKEMFEALRAAYEDLRPGARGDKAERDTLPTGVVDEEPPSLVVGVTFGSDHDQAMALERKRSREAIEALSSLSVLVEPETG